MRRGIVAVLAASLVVSGAFMGGGGSISQAAATWPARCKTYRCVNQHLNNLNNRLGTVETSVADVQRLLDQCLRVTGITAYGIPSEDNGYVYAAEQEFFLVTALDFTDLGGGTSDIFAVVDTCGLLTEFHPYPSRGPANARR